MKNVILIGMPGSGKTSLGKAVSKKLDMHFIDLDSLITERHGDITIIFNELGESAFRQYETEALNEAIKYNNSIISTGGGIIETQENNEIMKEYAVIFIDRSPEAILRTLDSDSRPLLKDKKDALHKLYNRRYNKYIQSMNFHIHNDESFKRCAEEIAKIIKTIKG
ncbi:MAG: shikimate kinase [Clostridiales bacterium]|nr:shikimate kinase [Clostridiales bacterium]